MGSEGGGEEGIVTASKMALVLAAKSQIYNTSPESPNMFASPLHTLASVPFCWEEEPGKPKHLSSHLPPHSYTKCLELPPRLLFSSEFTKLPSPASGALVIAGRRAGHEGKSGALGLWKGKGKRDVGRGSYVFPSCFERESGITTSVKITRVERSGSLYSHFTHRSHFWTSVYRGFKQMAPWKCQKLGREGF